MSGAAPEAGQPSGETTAEVVKSPLTGAAARAVSALPLEDLINAYRREEGIDVRPYLPEIDSLTLYRCPDTDLKFFGPGDLADPPQFYADLYSVSQELYQEAKWEFAYAAKLLSDAGAVLDVGCGGGDFLAQLNDGKRRLAGLDTSSYSKQRCAEKGIDVHAELIGDHADRNEGAYDAVTAFQVLEHVSDPLAFVKDCLKALKPGGRLIISTPNNQSFLRYAGLLPLDSSPHHVTRWGRASLEALCKLTPMSLLRIDKEPLQKMNYRWYQAVYEDRYLPRSRFLRSLYYRIGGAKAFTAYVAEQANAIDGHTILAVYQKH